MERRNSFRSERRWTSEKIRLKIRRRVYANWKLRLEDGTISAVPDWRVSRTLLAPGRAARVRGVFFVRLVKSKERTEVLDGAGSRMDETSEGEREQLFRYCDNGFWGCVPERILRFGQLDKSTRGDRLFTSRRHGSRALRRARNFLRANIRTNCQF